MLFLCHPTCTTCAKARKWLGEQGIAFTERSIAVENPNEEELRAWHMKSGLPLKRFFNTSGNSYRNGGFTQKLPTASEAQQYSWLAADGMLVKRPILVADDFVLVGFKPAEWAAAFSAAKV